MNYILLGYPALASRVLLSDHLSERYALLCCAFNDNGVPWELEALRFHNAIRRSVHSLFTNLLSRCNLG